MTDARTPTALIARADAALYQAKRSGRNRCAPPLDDGRPTPISQS